MMFLLLYVDDMLLTGNNLILVSTLLAHLNKEFRMKDLRGLQYFLGIQAHYHSEGLFLHQEKYAMDLLVAAGMADCTPMPTPLPLQLDKVRGKEVPFTDPTYFRSLAGKLQYLTLTRPDMQFAVNLVCQKMHSPSMADIYLLKRVMRYLKGTVSMGLNIYSDTDSTLRVYSDSDWANCKETRRSVGGFCTFLGSNIISWSAKRYPTVSRSSTEAEYKTLSIAASELKWISLLLRETGVSQPITPELYCDNLSAVYLTTNPAMHNCSKSFDVDFHFVRERVALGALVVKHVPAEYQLADIFKKSLPQQPYFDLRYKLGVVLPPTPSLRGCINQDPTVQTEGISSSAFESLKASTEMGIKHITEPITKSTSISCNGNKALTIYLLFT
ncbi:PREDICTED: uncharacterized protein LOC109131191 [Camelina sativa]|uniref:Uncharacterized protein LOC109131191 n=1 Tax=Camelina sativa TaxID=90675 RepID=A0ABM1REI2_CAMSA|nr:PREDICTED: uncharacterized protein LOC109131191 [Camelina sativa]